MRARAAASLLLGAVLASCAPVPKGWDDPPCRRVWVYWNHPHDNHTGLLIPRADFPLPEALSGAPEPGGRRRLLSEAQEGVPALTDWVEVGFASDDYLLARHGGKTSDAWKILRGSPGAMYVRPFPLGRNPEDWDGAEPYLHPLDLPAARYRALLAFVGDSFARDGGAPALQFVQPDVGAVYRSRYQYSYRRFCNVWALDALRAGGVSISRWMPSSSQVRYWLENNDPPAPSCAAPDGPAGSR